jgi:hypothetical protein
MEAVSAVSASLSEVSGPPYALGPTEKYSSSLLSLATWRADMVTSAQLRLVSQSGRGRASHAARTHSSRQSTRRNGLIVRREGSVLQGGEILKGC